MGMRHRDEGGFSFLKAIMWLAIAGGLVILVGKVVPAWYDYILLKDLAKRVVTEWNDEKPAEVDRRVEFELDRSNIFIPDDGFLVEKSDNGYKVTIDYKLPITLIPSDPPPEGEEEELEPGKDDMKSKANKLFELKFFYETES